MNEKIIVLKVIKEMMKFQDGLLLDDSKLQVTCIILAIANKWDLLDDYEILLYKLENIGGRKVKWKEQKKRLIKKSMKGGLLKRENNSCISLI